MASYIRTARPRWFTIVAALLVLWGVAGIFAFYSDVTMNESRLAAMADYDRRFFLTRPGWFIWVYGAAVWAGLFGAAALLMHRRLARPLYIVSLIAVVVQFGWVFLATDLIAAKGAATVVPFPVVILAVTLFGLWLSTHAGRRGWLR
ncbi:hypothetical protein [Sphingomonas sp. Y38-1Y]|uniref:hypothetical protein n=1 Tax=Sphingomonas sp. Y38-1Y TaxID=3078265 RepID=UPI0028EACBEA|nr:hypothetical protein [Sphingomonas sp. Y38-1Y]